MARFFIDRPVFAWVIAIIIMLAGGISILNLPISQYPSIAPPTIGITAQYPGASAQTVQDTVTQVIEQNMNGLDYLLYMSSTSDSSGQAQITLTFSADANPDIAQVQVQNKLQLATPLLPQEVQRQGISVAKRGANFLKVYAFVSEDGSMDNADIADYVATNLKDAISRISGVGEVSLFGSQYGMRIWLDPHKLQSYKLMPSDVINAINAQNAQVSAGQLGGTPSVPGQQMNLAISVQERLQTPEQFGNVILRTNPDGSLIRVKDVARVELGSESYSTLSRYNGKPATGIAVKLATGANALETASNIDDYLKGAEAFFPQGLKAVYPFDTTPVVKISIHEVVKTLGEAVLLSLIHICNDLEVVVHGLLAGFAELQEDVVVGHAGEQAHFIEFHIMGDLEVVHVGADPAGDAGEAVASGAADFNSLAILGGIHEKFGGLDESALAAELVEQVVDAGDLLDGIRGSGLLAVTEGCVGDEHGIGRAGDEECIVEFDAADMRIWENVAVQFGFDAVVQRQGAGSMFLIQ